MVYVVSESAPEHIDMDAIRCLNIGLYLARLLIIDLSFSHAMINHYTIPSCESDVKICEFTWDIREQKTMVVVDKIRGTSHPVVYREGRYWRRITCDVMEPLTDEGNSPFHFDI